MQKLDSEGVEWDYELTRFKIIVPAGTVNCPNCGKITGAKESRYTPDFFFPNWVIEAKGKFTAKDRKRFLALFLQHGRVYRFGLLFMRDNKISKSSKTRYSDWCEKNGIPYAFGWFKKEWLR